MSWCQDQYHLPMRPTVAHTRTKFKKQALARNNHPIVAIIEIRNQKKIVMEVYFCGRTWYI